MHSFFRPHRRLEERGELVNLHTGEVTRPPSMTKQEFAAECDINNILKHFSKTGMLNHVSARAGAGVYQDLPDPIDFQEGMAIVQRATESFMTLPSKIRARFENDPAEFLAFMADPQNVEEIKALGLTNPLPQAPPAVRVIMDPPPEPQNAPAGGVKGPA